MTKRSDVASEWRLPVADAADTRRATWQLIRGDGRALVLVVTLNCLAAAAGLAGPWLLGDIVSQVESEGPTSEIDLLALAILGFGVAQLLLLRFARYAAHRFGERALARLRADFIDQVLTLPTSVVERAGTGDLMTRSSADVSTVGGTLREAAPEVFISTVQVAFVLCAVVVLDPRLGLCAIVGLPVVWSVTRWYLNRARDAYLDEGATGSRVAEELAATTAGARTVEALGLRGRRIERGDASIAAAYATRMRTLFLRSVLFPVVDMAHAMPVVLVLLVGGAAYTNGWTSLGTVIAATLYMWQLVDPLDRILMWIDQLQRSATSLARIKGIDRINAVGPEHGGVPVDDRLELVDVRFAYAAGHDVLHGIDLVVRPGERLAVVGPSGAGKSTLGRLMAGVDAPRTGRVTVGDVPVSQLAPGELRRRILLVTQEHHVFLANLRENLAIAAPTATDDMMLAALAAVEADWVSALPDGLDTACGPGGSLLNATQAQQLSLARVLLADPHTLILDESTALLDPATARHAERTMAVVLAGRTVIAIAHRLHTARDADRILVIEGGRVAESGRHDELVDTGGSYAALWRSWRGIGHRATQGNTPPAAMVQTNRSASSN